MPSPSFACLHRIYKNHAVFTQEFNHPQMGWWSSWMVFLWLFFSPSPNFVGSLMFFIDIYWSWLGFPWFPMVSHGFPQFLSFASGKPMGKTPVFSNAEKIWGDTDVEDPKSHPRLQDRSIFCHGNFGGEIHGKPMGLTHGFFFHHFSPFFSALRCRAPGSSKSA